MPVLLGSNNQDQSSSIKSHPGFPLIIGYYTLNTPYEREAETLKLSLEPFEYASDIRGVPNLGSWQKNTQYKAIFIRERLLSYPGKPLLYIDVDALVIQPLTELASLHCDIAAVHFCNTKALASGTVFLGNTPKCLEVVERWISLNQKYPERLPGGMEAWDQRTLEMAIKETPGVHFHELPQEYTWITELTPKRMPRLSPKIVHTRGAFRFKKTINQTTVPKVEEVWVVWPSANAQNTKTVIPKWHKMGYKVCVLAELQRKAEFEQCGADKILFQPVWLGFPKAVNFLLRSVPGDVVVVAGDDIWPDPSHHALTLAKSFKDKFPDLFGIMQPAGDKYGLWQEACISPWIGRVFINQAYEGKGPYWEEYFHYFSDAELRRYAEGKSVLWYREDVTQYHDHWQRRNEDRPTYLNPALNHWESDKRLYEARGREEKATLDLEVPWRKFFLQTRRNRESASGAGSSLENTKEIREALPRIFKKHSIISMVDVPCGDWNWMQKVPLNGVRYLGCDLIPEIIEQNQRKFEGVRFEVLDAVQGPIPKADLVLCRDFLFHLPNASIIQVLKNIKESRSKYLLTTYFPTTARNQDVVVNANWPPWHPINLLLPPFSLRRPIEIVQENNSDACRGRVLGLFCCKELP